MNMIKVLIKRSRLTMGLALVSACLSALTSIALIHMITSFLSRKLDAADSMQLLLFVVLIGVSSISAYWAHVVVTRLGVQVTRNMTIMVINRVIRTGLKKLESLGGNRLYATVTGDISSINSAISMIPNAIICVGCLLAGLAYMSYLAWQFIFILIFFVAVLAFISHWSSKVLVRYFSRLRSNSDQLHYCYQGIFHGIKELKLDNKFSQYFVSQVFIPVCKKAESLGLTIGKRHAAYYNLNLAVFFLVIAYVIFVPYSISRIDLTAAIGITITLLYLQGPLNELFQAVPVIAKGNVAISRVNQLSDGLVSELDVKEGSAFEEESASLGFKQLRYKGVSYYYSDPKADGEKSFQLGPVDLTLGPGRILFITGGNGAGKSTLAKLLCALYVAQSGSIELNGKELNQSQLASIRSYFYAIFPDFQLFKETSSMHMHLGKEQMLMNFCRQLALDHKIDFSQGETDVQALSQGQKKRLALLYALMSERPILLFDEWAADQDPFFREYFYMKLLPELRAAGKCCVVISHDDRYFHCADELYKLEYGELSLVNEVPGKSRKSA